MDARFAVVIPAFDAMPTLERCIAAVQASEVQPARLIVVDDGSSDGSGALAARLGAKVVRTGNRRRGPGLARDLGVAQTDCALVVFVDADVVVHPDAIARLLAAFDTPGVAAAFGSYDAAPPYGSVASVYANLRHHLVHQRGSAEAGTFWAGIGAVRRGEFLAVGGFGGRYPHSSIEDVELGIRMREAGLRIRLVPQAQGTHLKAWRLGQLWHTDIFRRALPWSELIASGRGPADQLNLRGSERAAAMVAALVPVLALAALLVSDRLWIGAAAGLLLWLWLNRGLAALLCRVGPRYAAGGLVLHWVYYLYSSLVLAAVLAKARLRR